MYAPTPNGQSPSASLNKSNTPGTASLLLKMPPKNVCKRKTKTSTSTDNVEHSDRETGESGHESDEGGGMRRKKGTGKRLAAHFPQQQRSAWWRFCSKHTVLRQDTAKLASMGLSYTHVYIYRNKRTLALRTHTYNVRASKNTIRELCV